MVTNTSKGAELRYPNENGGEGIAAHMHYRQDSNHNFVLELHVPNPTLLAANLEDAAKNIEQFIEASKAEMKAALGLPADAS